MVDFRYHLVSIIAVFLALALGIVVGTTALNGRLLDGLRGSINTLTAEKRELEAAVGDLRGQTSADDRLVEQLGPGAVAGVLDGERVVLVNAPNAPAGVADALEPLLQQAGATVSGQVGLRPDLLDPDKREVVARVVAEVAPAGVDLTSEDPVEQAGQELGAALLRPAGGGEGISAAAADSVLAGFQDLDLIDLGRDLGARATLAVVVTGTPATSADPSLPAQRVQGLLSVTRALDEAGRGAVLVGPLAASDPGGALAALRADGGLSERVSSVDGADRAPGRLSAVFALREQAAGAAGRYGSGPGSDGALPSPAPR